MNQSPTYEASQRPDGSYGIKDGEQIKGSFNTRAEALACIDGITWERERLGAPIVEVASVEAATTSPSVAGSVAGHTPGPWVVSTFAPFVVNHPVSDDSEEVRLVAATGYHDGTPASKAEAHANARLIASTPMMLEALRDVRIFVQDCIETGHDRGSLGNLYAARDTIDAAIAKATAQASAPTQEAAE